MTLTDIRYYMGRIKCRIRHHNGKKALIVWLDVGRVGNKTEGYKEVNSLETDIVPIRMCWRKKK